MIENIKDQITCDECEHLLVLNGQKIYAICLKSNYIFRPFETDTRIHYCAFGKRKETTPERFKKIAETIRYDELRVELAEMQLEDWERRKR